MIKQTAPNVEAGVRRARWVRVWERGDDEFYEHRDGVPWDRAPLPRYWHNCLPQTRGTVRVSHELPLMTIQRCACGAADVGDDDGWQDKMSRQPGRQPDDDDDA